jgi:hypothetical protein
MKSSLNRFVKWQRLLILQVWMSLMVCGGTPPHPRVKPQLEEPPSSRLLEEFLAEETATAFGNFGSPSGLRPENCPLGKICEIVCEASLTATLSFLSRPGIFP